MAVTPLNWNTTFYKSLDLKAFISIGANPAAIEEIVYLVNLTDEDNRDYFQQEFKSLDEACRYINQRWGEWEEADLATGSGCGSCAAH